MPDEFDSSNGLQVEDFYEDYYNLTIKSLFMLKLVVDTHIQPNFVFKVFF
jgi:hypothetical protein